MITRIVVKLPEAPLVLPRSIETFLTPLLLNQRWQRPFPPQTSCQAELTTTAMRRDAAVTRPGKSTHPPPAQSDSTHDPIIQLPDDPVTRPLHSSSESKSQPPIVSHKEKSLAAADQLRIDYSALQQPQSLTGLRRPRSVQAIHLKPLKRTPQFGVATCDLQLRSYNVRNVEFFADFSLRAAYYLGLPALGPVPLPRIIERWTVPRSNFVHKKSQENFERITMRRLIQIQDGNLEQMETWLAFLRKHAYYGIGMKANVWQHEKLGVGKTMDVSLENLRQAMEPRWAHFGRRKTLETSERAYEMMKGEAFQQVEDGFRHNS